MARSGDETGPNVRASRYIIVESKMACPHCSGVTAVFALALPAEYQSFNLGDDDQDGTWEVPGMAAVLSYLEYLPSSVADRIQKLTAHYRVAPDSEGGAVIWRNHCEHCRAGLEEEELHGELDSPFGPLPAEGLDGIQLHHVREPFEARAGGESHDVKRMDS